MWDASPTDPRTHEAAIRIARRCVHIVRALLREEEAFEACREFYQVAREELERWKVSPPRN
jgi:hypothetical protein